MQPKVTSKRPISRRRRFLRRAAVCLLGLYALAVAGCAAFQRKLIYFPSHPSSEALDRFAKSQGIERWNNPAGQPIGWRKLARQSAKGQLLVTHGNGGCAIDRFGMAQPLAEAGGLDIYVLEYPGFGDRSGSPTEQEFFRAADDAMQSLPANTPTYLLGESLGTGVAAYIAGKHPDAVAGVFLMAPYNRLVDIAQHHIKILPASWILCDRYPSDENLTHYQGPVAILVGSADTVVPAKFGKRLFDGYAGPKKLWEIPDGGHESIHDEPPEFWNDVIAFWRGKSIR